MLILLLFTFISGLITILAPCIWPLLPIVFTASATGGSKKPLGITLGIMTSFATFTLTISYLVKLLGLDANFLRSVAVVVIALLGITLIFPPATRRLEAAVSQLAGKVKVNVKSKNGLINGFLTGISLGIVWSPCAGPILATIATLAATQKVTSQVILITFVYVTGIGIPLFLFTYLGNKIFAKSKFVNRYTAKIQQIFGLVMIISAVAIYTNYDKVAEAKLLNLFPSYSNILTKLESQSAVTSGLKELKKPNNQGNAPNFVGITNWLNSPPLNITDLKGKVVLVDFWTYTCINCIRTLPYVTSWYEKYHNQGFVVVGVHTPEFEFEKRTENVQNALKQYKINYPVAQDNNYETWDAFDNRYWPAKYLIDAQGNIRYTHFGEGDYDKTEKAIQDLLKEAGQNPNQNLVPLDNQTPQGRLTPETYLGKKRMQNFVSDPTSSLPLHYFSYDGTWDIEDESATTQENSAINLNFYASKVFLVITPNTLGNTVKVFLDNKEIDSNSQGADVKNGQMILDVDRLYNIVDLKDGPSNHILRLEFQNPGTKVFAFTFG